MTKIKDFISELTAHGKRVFTISEIKNALGTSEKSVWSAVARLKKRGEIASPANGFYLIIPPEYRVLGCLPPELFISQLMSFWDLDYYVCLLSAAMYHGASHQQPQIFQVMVAKNRSPVSCEGVKIEFVSKNQRELSETPAQKIKTQSGYINVSTPEATAMDLLTYLRKSAGVSHVATVLDELAEQMKPEPLLLLAEKSLTKSWVQRLGYLLDFLEKPELSDTLFDYVKNQKTEFIPLAPYLSREKIKKNNKWRVIVNTVVESDI